MLALGRLGEGVSRVSPSEYSKRGNALRWDRAKAIIDEGLVEGR